MAKSPKTFAGSTYFVTLKTVGWTDVFIRADYREEIARNLQYCRIEKGLEIHSFCLMTNHLHLIGSGRSASLESVIRDFKSYTAKKIIGMIRDNPQESRRDWLMERFAFMSKVRGNDGNFQFWERDNYPEEIWSEEFFRQKQEYIHQNPVKAGFVGRAEDWLYSSACPDCPVMIDRVD